MEIDGPDPGRGAVARLNSHPEATHRALVMAAERLIADRGVDNVSLHDVGAAIGLTDTDVVTRHFDSKETLVEEVFRHRAPGFERRRGELLEALDSKPGGATLRELLFVLWRPYIEQTDTDGRHSYAAFLASMARSPLVWTRLAISEDYLVSSNVGARISGALPPELRPRFFRRLQLVSAVMASTLAALDREISAGEQVDVDDWFQDALSMMEGALAAPAPEQE